MLSGREGSDRIGAWLESPVTVLSARPTRRCRQSVKEASNMSNSIACDDPSVKVIVGVDSLERAPKPGTRILAICSSDAVAWPSACIRAGRFHRGRAGRKTETLAVWSQSELQSLAEDESGCCACAGPPDRGVRAPMRSARAQRGQRSGACQAARCPTSRQPRPRGQARPERRTWGRRCSRGRLLRQGAAGRACRCRTAGGSASTPGWPPARSSPR